MPLTEDKLTELKTGLRDRLRLNSLDGLDDPLNVSLEYNKGILDKTDFADADISSTVREGILFYAAVVWNNKDFLNEQVQKSAMMYLGDLYANELRVKFSGVLTDADQ